MKQSKKMKQDLDLLQQSFAKLRQELQGISPLWQDEKYTELQESVASLASHAHSILEQGYHCTEELEHFQSISSETF